jgi:hypothetical protein
LTQYVDSSRIVSPLLFLNTKPETNGAVLLRAEVLCGEAYHQIERRPYEVPRFLFSSLVIFITWKQGFLVHFESEVLKRAHKNFSFRNGSVGNYLLAAAQDFFRSLPSAIFFFSSITNSQANILPVLVTNHTVTIAAELVSEDAELAPHQSVCVIVLIYHLLQADSSTLVGQCEISHPVKPVVSVSPPLPADLDAIDGNRLLATHNASFEKSSEDSSEGYNSLPARIARTSIRVVVVTYES